jgi:phosphoserine phosphatase
MTGGPVPLNPRVLSPGRWSTRLREELEAMVVRDASEAGSIPPLATFDWDDTCIRGDLAEAVLQELDARQGSNRFGTYMSLIEEAGDLEAYIYCATALAGHTELALRTLASQVLEQRLVDGRIAPRMEILDLISALRQHGWEVWIVSAAAEVLVQVAAERHGLDPSRVIGVKLAAGRDKVLRESVIDPFPHREGKIAAIERWIGRPPVFAAGNADSDIEMLDVARFQLVIDNGSTALRELANERGWWVQTGWDNPRND